MEGIQRWKASVVDASVHSQVGESPVWSVSRQVLFYVDIEGRTLHRFDPATKLDTVFTVAPTPMRLGTIVLCSVPRRDPATFVCGAEHALVVVQLHEASKQARITRVLAQLPPHAFSAERPVRFNDGKADSSGCRVVVGTMSDVRPRMAGVARLYSFSFSSSSSSSSLSSSAVSSSSGGVLVEEESAGGLSVSNGLCWSCDGKWLFHIDTPSGRVSQFHYNSSPPTGGCVVGKKVRDVVVKPEFLLGGLDGMVIDSEGQLWIAHHRGGIVSRWSLPPLLTDSQLLSPSSTGGGVAKLTGIVEVPTKMTTSLCFGGADLTTLFITSSTSSTDDPGNPLTGCLFSVNVGIKGTPLFELSSTF